MSLPFFANRALRGGLPAGSRPLSSSRSLAVMASMHTLIEEKLRAALDPAHLEVINESSNHNVPKGAESHFKVVVVSGKFEGKPLLARHRMVNEALREELKEAIHALTMTTKTPAQWAAAGGSKVEPSPQCLGGMKREQGTAGS